MRYADINVPHLIKSEAVCQKKTMTMEFQKKTVKVLQWYLCMGIYAHIRIEINHFAFSHYL